MVSPLAAWQARLRPGSAGPYAAYGGGLPVPMLEEFLPLCGAAYHEYAVLLVQALQMPAVEYLSRYTAGSESDMFSARGITMQSVPALMKLKQQLEDIVDRGLDGDIYETGTWRGGTAIFMVAILTAYERLQSKQQPERHFWFFDSFEGFRPEGLDAGLDQYLSAPVFAAPLEDVRASFEKFGVMSDRVHLVKGFFEVTLPPFCAKRPIAVLRLDGDLYSSTKVALECLYPSVQPGGWVIVDDYYWCPPACSRRGRIKLCHEAVDEYRGARVINSPMTTEYDRPSWMKPDHEGKLPVARHSAVPPETEQEVVPLLDEDWLNA